MPVRSILLREAHEREVAEERIDPSGLKGHTLLQREQAYQDGMLEAARMVMEDYHQSVSPPQTATRIERAARRGDE